MLPKDGLVQERHNSSALAIELRLSCTNPSIKQSIWSSLLGDTYTSQSYDTIILFNNLPPPKLQAIL